MLFNSGQYFIFLPIVLVLYYALNHRLQNRMLLVASYIFYGFWDYRFLLLIALSTTVDYFAGRAIYEAKTPAKRRLFLGLSLGVNLGILGFFKYFNFFVDNASRVLALGGLHIHPAALYIILPVGVSFYTFQEITYTVDIYRGQMKPVRNFLDFALFVCYFPQLVAGPIERARNLVPKLQAERVVTTEQFVGGCLLILFGLFRKVVIADALGPQIDPVFAHPAQYSSPELLKALYLFALQIYCDFAGYSDIARGTSRLLGIELMVNFRQPYFSAGLREFWQRWHISLSSWLRDYLYIPLGGNRHGEAATYRNLMLTMLIGGLWHGASWAFVVWGGLHGLYQVGERLYHRLLPRLADPPHLTRGARIARQILAILVTFHLVLLAWIFFRAPGFSAALVYLKGIVAWQGMNAWTAVLPGILVPWLMILPLDLPQFLTNDELFILRVPQAARNVALAGMAFLIFLSFGTHAPFIYFQF